MAKIGLKHVVIAPVATNTASGITYSAGKVLGEAVKADVKITSTDDKLYADDMLVENVKSFVSGDLTLEINELDKEDYATYFGHTLDSTTSGATAGELTADGDDLPIDAGVGFCGVVIKSGTKYYRGIWLCCLAFKEPDEAFATKADKITFGTHSLSGTFKTAKNGKWKIEKTFTTESDAFTWLNGKAGITNGD